MLGENKLEWVRNENQSILILSMLFIVFLLVAICALSVMALSQLKELRPTNQQDLPGIMPPVTSPPETMPDNLLSIYLPIIQTGSLSGSEPIWKVFHIESLGYELGGQRYDLATFTRLDDQDTQKGYCMNRGWDIPAIGTEYFLNEEGIFVPLYEPEAHPLQRFLIIQ